MVLKLFKLSIYVSANAHLPGMFLFLHLFLEFCIELVITELLCIKFIFSTMISYKGALDFVTGCPSGVYYRGLTH